MTDSSASIRSSVFRAFSFARLCTASVLLLASCPVRPAFAGSKLSVHVRGATALVPAAELVAEEFMAEFPDSIIVVEGGGTRRGIKAVLDGTADVGLASSSNFHELTGGGRDLEKTVVAHGAVVVIVHPSNPVSRLTVNQLRQVFSGAAGDWKNAGGRPGPVTVCTYDSSSGDRSVFQALVMEEEIFSTKAVNLGSDSLAMRKYVASHPGAVGYIGVSYESPEVKMLAVDGVLPSEKSLRDKTYPLDRELILYTRKDAPEAVRRFVRFFLDPGKGQRILRSVRAVPVSDRP